MQLLVLALLISAIYAEDIPEAFGPLISKTERGSTIQLRNEFSITYSTCT